MPGRIAPKQRLPRPRCWAAWYRLEGETPLRNAFVGTGLIQPERAPRTGGFHCGDPRGILHPSVGRCDARWRWGSALTEASTNRAHIKRHPSTVSLSVLEGVRNQDQEAWDRLVYLYGPMVYQEGRRRGLQPSDAKDLVQEVFIRVREGLPKFDHDRQGATFTGWLRTIAQNCIKDHWRRHGEQAHARGGDDTNDPIDTAPAREEDEDQQCSRWVQEVVGRSLGLLGADFTERSKQVFLDYTVYRIPVAEVANRYGMSRAAVRQTKARVLRRLREELRGLVELAEDAVSG